MNLTSEPFRLNRRRIHGVRGFTTAVNFHGTEIALTAPDMKTLRTLVETLLPGHAFKADTVMECHLFRSSTLRGTQQRLASAVGRGSQTH